MAATASAGAGGRPLRTDITVEEVSRHNTAKDCWLIIAGRVYNVTPFVALHPGGRHVLLKEAGKDATELFSLYHSDAVLRKYGPKFLIGYLAGHAPSAAPSSSSSSSSSSSTPPAFPFGDMVPYGDPIWYQRLNSPYFKATHIRWRETLRRFTDTEILPTMDEWVTHDRAPDHIYEKMGKLGLLAAMCGPPWPAAYLPAEVKAPENFDYFHELIVYDEISRCGSAAVIAALTNGPAIGLPPILRFGSEAMKRRIAPDVLLGRKFIALAISEPGAGSDVAGLECVAKKEGDVYVVNGNKKWITNGMYADYFSTAVVTGKPGQSGMSFLLVDKDTPGFSVRRLKIRDSHISGTAYLDFDQCRVPVANLIGKENQGFKLVMFNFNHERFYVTTCMTRLSRVCIEESMKYAQKRKTFGKPLHNHQAIRMKIASMVRQVEQLQTWLEYLVYQMCTMSHEEANMNVGDLLSLLKAQGSKVYEHCARETTMIFGGNALYMGESLGKKIEPAVMQVKGYQIPAGAEDTMDDFGARSAFRRAAFQSRL